MKARGYTKETIASIGVVERNFSSEFSVGDKISVTTRVVEGSKERLQKFNGIVIAMRGKGASKTFTVRKVQDGIAIERVFPFYSPLVVDVERTVQGKVRRAKLYYLRGRIGKKAMEVPKKIIYKNKSKANKAA